MKLLYSMFRKKIKLKNTFQKLIISYIMIISIILLIASGVMYRGYKNQIIAQSGTISQKLLNQGEYYTEYTLRWASSYIYQLYLDKDVYGIMFHSNINDTSAGINKIKHATMIQPTIQSIYIFNNNSKMIYPSDGDPEYFSIYDNGIEELLKANDETMSTKFIPRKIKKKVNGKEYEKDVLSLMLRNVNAPYSSLPYGAIILNLDAGSVQQYFRNITEKDYNIFAIDTSGKLVLNSDPGLFLNDISDKDYVKKVLSSKSAKGSFTCTIDGNPSIVAYKNSERLGMKFISVIPYESLTDVINSMLITLVKTSVLIFLLAAVIVFFWSKKIYSPVERAFKTLRSYLASYGSLETEADENKKSDNEMDYMAKMLEIIVNNPIPSQKLSESDLSFIRKQLLTGLLLNTTFEISSLKRKLEELGINMDFQHIVVVLFKTDTCGVWGQEHSREEYESMKNTAYQQVEKYMEGIYRCKHVVTDEDEFCAIINTGEEPDSEKMGSIIKTVREFQDYMNNNYSISVTTAIGDYVHDIVDTSKSYKSAREYMNYRIKYGIGSTLYSSKISSEISNDCKYAEDIEEAIFKELKAGNAARLETELNRMFGIIMSMPYSDMVLSVSRLLDSSRKVISNMFLVNGSDMNTEMNECIDNIKRLPTLEEKKQHLLRLYSDTINQLKDKKKNRKNEVVEVVISYINENYPDPLLSPDIIAENMNLSPNYLRTLFKDSEGKSLSNYINEVRFEKAKSLLEQTELTVSEISTKVGMTNYNYFYTAFKKFYGVSPNYYRNNVKTQSNN